VSFVEKKEEKEKKSFYSHFSVCCLVEMNEMNLFSK